MLCRVNDSYPRDRQSEDGEKKGGRLTMGNSEGNGVLTAIGTLK